MIRIFVKSPNDDVRLKFVLKQDSTFGYLRECVATHFNKDLTTLQLYIGDELLCLQDDVPINTFLKTGDTLQVRSARVAVELSDLSSRSLLSLNGGYSEEDALQVALSHGERATSLPASSRAPTAPSNDSLGATICTGNTSQYSSGGGNSACTSICLIAAYRLLNSDMQSLLGSDLDEIVHQGVQRHAELGVEHTSVDDLWGLPLFSDIRHALQLHESYQGHLSSSSAGNEFLSVLQRALTNSAADSDVAILLTKTPETVLCLSMPSGFYLFDSHGQSHETEKRTSLKRFGCIEELANALLQKYPPQQFDDEQSMFGDLYNTFEAFPVTFEAFPVSSLLPPSLPKSIGRTDSAKDGFDEASVQQAVQMSLNRSNEFQVRSSQVECSSEPEISVEPALVGEPLVGVTADESFANEECKPPALDVSPSATATASTANSSSHTPTAIHGLFERDDYEDPISKEIMADPVKCTDGYTYERQNIERHFRTCMEAEQERQAELEGEQPTESADVCCGARRPVELISPLTGGVVSDTLLPDKNLERTIVRLVENRALGMTEEEIRDWTELREEKRINDREREQELQAARANELRMAEQAAQAEERRQAERNITSAPMEPAPTNDGNTLPAMRVRVDRNIRIDREKLDDNDTGLSVSLCEQGDRIFPEYIIASSQQVRCMVICCAIPMDPGHPSWCARCGRIVCQACLDFGVTDISEPNPTSLHAVCSECVTQTLDVIDLTDPRSCQTRDIIRIMKLQQDAARLSNAAADSQDRIVRYETSEAYQPRLEAHRRDIEAFQSRRQALEQQIQRAQDNARRTREAEGNDEDSLGTGTSGNETLSPQDIESLQQRHHQLEQELAGLTLPEDEEGQIAYVIRREALSGELLQVQGRLLEAVAPGSCTAAADDDNEEDDGEQSLEALNREYHRLVASRPPDDDEDAQMEYFVRLSELASRIERAHISHVAAESIQESAPEAAGAAPDSLALSRLLAAVEQYGKRRFLRKHPGRPRKSYVRQLRELTAQISRREEEGMSHTASYRRLVGELREHIDQLPRQCADTITAEVRSARSELDRKEHESSVTTGDPMEELMRLQRVNISSLDEVEQIEHVVRVSELQQTMKLLEEALLGSSADRVDKDDMATETRDVCATKIAPVQRQSSEATRGGTQVQSRQANANHVGRARASEDPTASTAPVQPVSEAVVSLPEPTPVSSAESSFSFTTLIRGIGGLMSYFSSPVASQLNKAPVDLEECRAHLEAIGTRETQWRLPLGLEYPTQSMDDQLDILKNSLELRLVDSQRRWDRELSQVEDGLLEELRELENAVQNLMAEANSAEASAAQAQAQLQERRRQRALERQRQEARRREEERRREEQERRAQAEARALQERHEEQTRQAFAAVRGGRNQARTFGGSGDLRMCGRCKAGPIENKACAHLDTHNGREHANHCPNCDWHDPNWHNWPYFDGIFGPH